MRDPWAASQKLPEGTWSEQAERMKLENAARWLEDHPDVPCTPAELVEAWQAVGQTRAAAAAVALGRWAAVERRAGRPWSPVTHPEVNLLQRVTGTVKTEEPSGRRRGSRNGTS